MPLVVLPIISTCLKAIVINPPSRLCPCHMALIARNAILSHNLLVNVHCAVLPEESVAVAVTVFDPVLKLSWFIVEDACVVLPRIALAWLRYVIVGIPTNPQDVGVVTVTVEPAATVVDDDAQARVWAVRRNK